MRVKTCPRCGSIDLKHSKNDRGPGYEGFRCQMCGWRFYSSEATYREFEGKKRTREKPAKEPYFWERS